MTTRTRYFFNSFIVLLALGLSACSVTFVTPEPTASATAIPTETPLPPTDTPAPTATPLPTDTPLPPTLTFTPGPTDTPLPTPTPEATPDEKHAILVYYISKDTPGRFGCGEALFWLNTGVPLSGNFELDVKTALMRMFSYRGETLGSLYNGLYPATFAVKEASLDADGTAYIWITGDYTKTNDSCDPRRAIDQIKQTVKQFEGVKGVVVYLNGTPISDALSRK